MKEPLTRREESIISWAVAIGFFIMIFSLYVGSHYSSAEYADLLKDHGWMSYDFDSEERLYAPDGSIAIDVEVIDE